MTIIPPKSYPHRLIIQISHQKSPYYEPIPDRHAIDIHDRATVENDWLASVILEHQETWAEFKAEIPYPEAIDSIINYHNHPDSYSIS